MTDTKKTSDNQTDFMGKDSLLNRFSIYEPLSLEMFLKDAIEYGRNKLGCKRGSVFLFNGATGRLEHTVHSERPPEPFSMKPGEGIAGQAYTKRTMICAYGQELTHHFIPSVLLSRDRLRAIIALPVFAFQEPIAVFCFNYMIHPESFTVDNQGLTEDETQAVEALWEEFSSQEFGRILHRVQIHNVQQQLRVAGNAPSKLRKEIGRFIANLQQAFQGIGQRVPDILYVQLVDHHQKMIRTIQGVGMPLSFEFSRAYSLDSSDIHADIVRNRQVEIIAGNDKKRFDQNIYHKYHHEQYVRLWVPLFPFPFSISRIPGKYQGMEDALENFLEPGPTEEKNCMIHQVFRWTKDVNPPQIIVFGTLEMGYHRDDSNHLSMAPWTNELVLWSLSRIYELSRELYMATLAGTLEQIGGLLASVSQAAELRFTYAFRDQKIKEIRNYPISSLYPVPHIKEDLPEMSKTLRSQVASYGPVTIERFAPLYKMNSLSVDYIRKMNKLNARIAGEAVEVAFRFYEAAMYPHELLDPHEDTIATKAIANGRGILSDKMRRGVGKSLPMGTLVNDEVFLSVCKEATRMSGASSCRLYFFVNESDSDQKTGKNNPLLMRPPFIWEERPNGKKLLEDKTDKLARIVASEKRPEYIEADYGICFFPLELSDGTTGVMVLVFPENYRFTDGEKRDMESWLPRWIHRISMRRLIMRNRFSALMRDLRREIVEARKCTEKEISSDITYITAFIKDVLQRSVKKLNSIVGLITLYTKPKTGPSRLERFWCWHEGNKKTLQVKNYMFINRSFSGPCYDSCDNRKLIVYGTKRKHQTNIIKVAGELRDEASKLEMKGEKEHGSQIKRLSDFILGNTNPSTMLTCPVLEKGEDDIQHQAAMTMILYDEHYYDEMHRILITELGDLLADNLSQMRNLERHRYEEKHHSHLEERRKSFEKAYHADDIIGAFLRKLGKSPSETNHPNQYWELADDVVIWNLSHVNNELVVRSARGRGIEALKSSNLEWINSKDHPLLAKEEILWPEKPGKGTARLKKHFRLWTFHLKNPSVGKKAKSICRAYANNIGREWLLTFPIVDALNRIFGVIDCLVDEPLPTEDETVLERMLHRLSRQLCSAVESCHLRRTRKITNTLYTKTGQLDRLTHTHDVYKDLVHHMKKEFRCYQCDLFLERHGQIILHTTTRSNEPLSDDDRFRLWLNPDNSEQEILGNCLNKGCRGLVQHAKLNSISTEHISPQLKELLSDDCFNERMALPLKAMSKDGEEVVVGILHLRGPFNTPCKPNGTPLKKSEFFTSEDLRFAHNLCLVIQRIVQMVRFVEHQGWLVNELLHTLGQHLQVLRSSATAPIRALIWDDKADKEKTKTMLNNINRAFDMVHEARNQIILLARLNQPDEKYSFESIKIKQLLKECCEFMSQEALKGNNRIEYGGVKAIDPVPLVKLWMRKAIINLLDNACKYSWKGRAIRVKATEDKEGNIWIEFTNWGIGIPEDHHKRIFEPYFRSQVPDAKGKRPGTGIGLPIVKEAIEIVHGGEIKFESKEYWKNKQKGSEISDKEITDIEYETTFIIMLRRNILVSLQNKFYI
ncbi:MAG: GAF domain-containing sensor histidine kinase [Desulfobacterales bacterium]|nr:GAF domain-containing sensor histidine kinase [Desulfobacterales bacterium]